MLTRLRVQGFKNCADIEIYLSPFTCIVGRNGVGKSNLFDAILFLKESVDRPLLEAALQIRGGDPLVNLFYRNATEMSFEVDFFISVAGQDDFGQIARASATFLTYKLTVGYTPASREVLRDNLRLISEELTYIPKGQAATRLRFRHGKSWLETVFHGSRRTKYISTHPESRVVRLHQDRQDSRSGGGRPWEFSLENLPRTVLSSATNAQESPTLVLARQALRNCTLLQLEPSALRHPDSFQDPTSLSPTGRHLPATLHRIAQDEGAEPTYTRISNRLSMLVDGVDSVRTDVNPERRLYTLVLRDVRGQELLASSLSDGTLRFLAMAVLELDPKRLGVLCLEEPENGIHPERMSAMMSLLSDIAVDPDEEVDGDNPLQQVLINTHSPLVLQLMDKASILFAEARGGALRLRPVSTAQDGVPLGTVAQFLDPFSSDPLRYAARPDTIHSLVKEQLKLF